MKPGIHVLSNEDYHKGSGLSKSGIEEMRRSPAHFKARYIDRIIDSDPTPAMLAGTLAHCATLEPLEFAMRYAVGPDVSRVTKAWKEFESSLPAGVTCIKPDDYAKAWAQSNALRILPDVADAMMSGRPEVSAYWTDADTGILCKCRPDWVHHCQGGAIILDVKTASDASPDGFSKAVAKFGYHRQAAWYSDGYFAASGVPVIGFVFAVVESEPPYAAACYVLDQKSVEQGRRECREALNKFAWCKANNEWPGYQSGISEISLPAWALA